MKILITGSEGVIGHTLTPMLSEEYEIVPFDIKKDAILDIRSFEILDEIMSKEKPDLCIHMAAQVGRFNGENDPIFSIESNMIGTTNVILACLKHNVGLINFSTSEVYGHNSVFGNPDILEQNGVYGLTKLAAEGMVKHWVDTYKLKAVSIRPFMVYGPHEVPNGVYRSAVSNFLNTASQQGTISAHEGCVRSWCYATDFVEGIKLVIKNFDSFKGYEAFSIGTEEYRTMEDCAKIAIQLTGKGSYVVEPVPQFFVSAVKKADFSRIKELGFNPQINLEEGMRLTWEWQQTLK